MTETTATTSSQIRLLLAWSLAVLLAIYGGPTLAQETCERTGIEFGFFNGVKTTLPQAQIVARKVLPNQYGLTTPDGQPITYTLYYNDNQAGITDFVETFEQRLQEQDGILAGRFELFFSAMDGGGSWWSQITETVPALGGLLVGLFDTFRSYLIRDMTADFGNPNTAVVSQRHREQIDHAVAMDKALLLFAHSQGNLFVNRAYDHALTRVGAESVRVVHVAPASPRPTGPHVLADLDLVINGLRLVGHVLPITDPIPEPGERGVFADLSNKMDLLGHGLLETYLNRNFQPSRRIRLYVELALAELRSPRKNIWPPYPDFVTNPWTGGSDPGLGDWTPSSASHALTHILYQSSAPALFTKQTNGAWSMERVRHDSPSGFWSETYEGPGMGGTRNCRWRREASLAGGYDFVAQCEANRVPYSPRRLGATPIELDAYESAPPGTQVQLNAYSVRAMQQMEQTDTGYSIRFLSYRTDNRYSTSPLSERQWSEEVTSTPGHWSGLETYERWLKAWQAYQTNEAERNATYLRNRAAYEKRRLACGAQAGAGSTEQAPPSLPATGTDPDSAGNCEVLASGERYCPT